MITRMGADIQLPVRIHRRKVSPCLFSTRLSPSPTPAGTHLKRMSQCSHVKLQTDSLCDAIIELPGVQMLLLMLLREEGFVRHCAIWYAAAPSVEVQIASSSRTVSSICARVR